MRYFLLTTSILAGLLLGACAEAPQSDSEALSSPELSEAASEPAPQKTREAKTKTAASSDTLPAKYQGLDSRDISRAEIDELIALQKEQKAYRQAYNDEYRKWRGLDSAIRGEQPKRNVSPREKEVHARLQTLNSKFELASSRKKYENLVPNILSKAEVQELITLEQAQRKSYLEFQKKIEAWAQQDPSTRGPQPQIDALHLLGGSNPRLRELQNKVQSADEIKRLKDRVNKVSATYNITLSDNEIGELTALEIESQKLEIEMTNVMMELQKTMTEAEKNGLADSNEDIATKALNAIPKHVFQRMLQIELRKETIKAPLEAAEKADQIRTEMTRLSEESGVVILSGELEEVIALRAEKDRIQTKTQYDAIHKWINEDGPINFDQPLPNDEDYARIKEIDARLKAISAPMNDAKNAALEAANPALKQQRLAKENRQKWADDWRDKQQSGEVPADALLQSPSYAELQDRVTDYGTKLKTRADKVGYNVSSAELESLEALNEEMMAIRKKVYDMEANGTAMVGSQIGGKSPTFGLTSGMFKVRLIEKKQRQILAGLSEAEAVSNGSNLSRQSETGAIPYKRRNSSTIDGHFDQTRDSYGAESIIESFRSRGIEVSQSEADDLLAFERTLKEE